MPNDTIQNGFLWGMITTSSRLNWKHNQTISLSINGLLSMLLFVSSLSLKMIYLYSSYNICLLFILKNGIHISWLADNQPDFPSCIDHNSSTTWNNAWRLDKNNKKPNSPSQTRIKQYCAARRKKSNTGPTVGEILIPFLTWLTLNIPFATWKTVPRSVLCIQVLFGLGRTVLSWAVNYPSIHPTSSLYLRWGCRGSRVSRAVPATPHQQYFPVPPRELPGQLGNVIPPASPEPTPGQSPSCTCLEPL